ncbi:MAG: glycerate kinase, partial [Phycisphaerae bacterium]|nr:glycerate kinase [Phycisphaerae bacterium]
VSGIDFIIARTGLAEEIADADWVITGEGRFDEQSLCGKVISGVAAAAARAGAKTVVIAGQVTVAPRAHMEKGIVEAFACKSDEMSLDYAIENAGQLLENAARAFAMKYL